LHAPCFIGVAAAAAIPVIIYLKSKEDSGEEVSAETFSLTIEW